MIGPKVVGVSPNRLNIKYVMSSTQSQGHWRKYLLLYLLCTVPTVQDK